MLIEPRRVLAVGAHTDDVEIGCGATLSRFRREGVEIMVVAFSRAEASLPAGAPLDTLEKEFRTSMATLGCERVFVGDVPVRRFDEHRQRVLDQLILLRRDFDPDLVLTMNSQDSHQDHAVVHQESIRAFRGINMLGYELPWNQRGSSNDLFLEISAKDLDVKLAMLDSYASQATLRRPYMTADFVTAAANFRGVQGRMPQAEMFEVISILWREA